jgi:hypothetical protein
MPNKIDLTGKRFGWLLVIKEIGRNKSEKILWLCKCRCGKEKVIDGGSLRNGDTVSCSCKKSSTHRKTKTKEYRIWADMIQRCHNPKCGNYKYYGLRGIKVCDEWRDSFEVFLKDMGKRPSVRHSIDRIDVNGNYEAVNCRWATREYQDNNKRSSIIVIINNKRITLKEWANKIGVTSTAIAEYIRRHSIEDAIKHYGYEKKINVRKTRN